MNRFGFIILALICCSGAEAKTRFEVYEGNNNIFEGTGGTKVTEHGVDFWTNGSPPSRYQIVGIITDNRGEGNLIGKAVGSKSVAKKVIKAGGNAVILLDQNSKVTGVISGDSWSSAVNEITTKMLVIRYVSQ
jgi:hypothetical protein